MGEIAEVVEYVLTLKDLLTGKLHEAHEAAELLETTMKGIEKISDMLSLGKGVFDLGEYIKGAGEKFEKLEQASAKLDANMESSVGHANVSRETLEKWAHDLRDKTGESMASLTEMQSRLYVIPNLTKANFQQAMGQVEDIAKETGKKVEETATAYGKALSNPAKNMDALSGLGIKVTETEKERIKHVQATNGKIAAQKELMDYISHSGYEGVAAKMFNADPMGRYKKAMEDTETKVGELVTAAKKYLAPALEWVAKKIGDMVDGLTTLGKWINDNKPALKALGVGVATVAGAWALYQLYTTAKMGFMFLYNGYLWAQAAASLAAGESAGVLTVAQWLLNAAMDANPIGAIIVGVTALIAIFYYLYEKVGLLKAGLAMMFGPFGIAIALAYAKFGPFHAALWSLAAIAKTVGHMVGGAFKGLGKAFHDAMHGHWSQAGKDIEEGMAAFKDGFKKIGQAAKEGYEAGMADFNAGQIKAGATVKKEDEKDKKEIVEGEQPDTMNAKKATGTKSITINISINKLVETLRINTTNLTDGAAQIEQAVANVLLQAVNDASIIADF